MARKIAGFVARTAGAVAAAAMPALVVADAAPAAWQCPAQPESSVVARDAGACMQRLADGVYVILHADATDEWPHGNTGVVEGRRSLFVIDSTYLPSRAAADIALLRKVTSKPVAYLTTTHWHMDHNNGAVAYMDAYPGLTYLVEEQTARWMPLNQRWWSLNSTAPDGARVKAIATLRADTEHGAANGPVIAQREGEQRELALLKVVAPNRTFSGRMDLDFEGHRIVLQGRGRANSPSDTTFYLPDEKILFAGDIVVHTPLPFVGGSYPYDWVRVIDELKQLPFATLVPGHGAVQRDRVYLGRLRDLLGAAVAGIEASLAAGRTLEQAQATIDLDAARAAQADWNGADVSAEDWAYTRTKLIERAWHNVRGSEY